MIVVFEPNTVSLIVGKLSAAALDAETTHAGSRRGLKCDEKRQLGLWLSFWQAGSARSGSGASKVSPGPTGTGPAQAPVTALLRGGRLRDPARARS